MFTKFELDRGNIMETHSMYSIVRDLYNLEGNQLENKEKTVKKKFKSIMSTLLIDANIFKNNKGHFAFTDEGRDHLISILNFYDRKKEEFISPWDTEGIDLDELKDLIDITENLLKAQLEGKILKDNLVSLHMNLNYTMKKTISNIQNDFESIIINEAHNLLRIDSTAFFNQEDKEKMLNLYRILLRQTNNNWINLIQYVSEERLIETSTGLTSLKDHLQDKLVIDKDIYSEIESMKEEDQTSEFEHMQGTFTDHVDLETIKKEFNDLKQVEETKHLKLSTIDDNAPSPYKPIEEILDGSVQSLIRDGLWRSAEDLMKVK